MTPRAFVLFRALLIGLVAAAALLAAAPYAALAANPASTAPAATPAGTAPAATPAGTAPAATPANATPVATAVSTTAATSCAGGSTAGSGTTAACPSTWHLSHGGAMHFCRTAQRVRAGAAEGLISAIAGTAGQRMVALAPLTCTGGHVLSNVSFDWQAGSQGAQGGQGSQHGTPNRTTQRHTTQSRSGSHGQSHRATQRRAATASLHLPAYVPLGAQGGSSADSIDIPQLLVKVLAVFLLLFLCLRVLKAVMPRLNGNGGGTSAGMVLHSEPMGPKWSVQVLDLGIRLVVVGVSGTNITTLTTIAEPAEVEALRARYAPKGRKGIVDVPGGAGIQPARTSRPEVGGPAADRVAERPSFGEALAITTGRVLGRVEQPATGGGAPVAEPTQPAGHSWEQELAVAMAAPVQQQTTPGGEDVLGGALHSLRAIRRQVERR